MQSEQEDWVKEADATVDRVLADNEGNAAAVYILWLTCTRFLAETGFTEAELSRDVVRHVRDQLSKPAGERSQRKRIDGDGDAYVAQRGRLLSSGFTA
jgi:hypothetical protein